MVRPAERNGQSWWSRIFRLFRASDEHSLREDLTDALSSDGAFGTAFTPAERAMLHNILRLREVRVEDVMIPRAEIISADCTITLDELMVMFEESGHSRMPVYGDTLDDPRGMVHIRDLVAYITKQARNRRRSSRNGSAAKSANGGTTAKKDKQPKSSQFDLSRVELTKTVHDAGIVRDVLFVPPSMLASDLMQRMQAMRIQMALVIDEYGGTDGLVSLEDIVEMVVGDIEDEHDDEADMISVTGEDVFVADARAELEDIAKVVGKDFEFGDAAEDVDTLGGLIFSVLGRIPARGEVVRALPNSNFMCSTPIRGASSACASCAAAWSSAGAASSSLTSAAATRHPSPSRRKNKKLRLHKKRNNSCRIPGCLAVETGQYPVPLL